MNIEFFNSCVCLELFVNFEVILSHEEGFKEKEAVRDGFQKETSCECVSGRNTSKCLGNNCRGI